jgi:hypothetical protein
MLSSRGGKKTYFSKRHVKIVLSFKRYKWSKANYFIKQMFENQMLSSCGHRKKCKFSNDVDEAN